MYVCMYVCINYTDAHVQTHAKIQICTHTIRTHTHTHTHKYASIHTYTTHTHARMHAHTHTLSYCIFAQVTSRVAKLGQRGGSPSSSW